LVPLPRLRQANQVLSLSSALLFNAGFASGEKRGGQRLTRAIRISDRLGVSGNAFSYGPRPKGMHEPTYRRLVKELQNLKCEYFGCLAVPFNFPAFEHPEQLEGR
jgi:hypothetical protein